MTENNNWLRRFLEHNENNVQESLNMLWETCTWRSKFGTNGKRLRNWNTFSNEFFMCKLIVQHIVRILTLRYGHSSNRRDYRREREEGTLGKRIVFYLW